VGRVGVISVVAALVLAAPASAGQLAYSAGAPSQVFTVGPHGGGARQITHDAGGAARPDWSPDGRSVAYDVGGARIVVASATGAGERFVAIGVSAIDPSWSPDSSQLAFTGVEYGENGVPENTSLYVTQADSSNFIRIGPGSQPDWSPRGNWIVYLSNPARTDGIAGIWRMHSDGSGNALVARSGSDPSFSPNGKRVVFVSGNGKGIYTVSMHGGTRRRVARDSRAKSSPVFSPNGHSIVYSTSTGLWKVSAKGGHPRRIASSRGGALSWQPR
jgi:Tol biopolymer transport system component